MRLALADGWKIDVTSQRKLGHVGVIDDVTKWIASENLGPDALDELDFGAFEEVMDGRRGHVKSALMNQRLLAGIGNVYADEILFASHLHPQAEPGQLRRNTLKKLFDAIEDVLRKAIDAHVNPDEMPSTFLLPHRHRGGQCPRCGRELRHESIAGRRTWYCPRDQRRHH